MRRHFLDSRAYEIGMGRNLNHIKNMCTYDIKLNLFRVYMCVCTYMSVNTYRVVLTPA